MVPQNFKNNEVTWKGMEIKIRGYAANHPAGVYVITGPAYRSINPATIGKNHVWVPDLLWKIMIDAQTGTSIAFLMPNEPTIDLSTFVVNIAMIEAATGIKFDVSLDKTTVASYRDWVIQTKVK
jgi:DNA/RNA endonuclease G (NUC1)